MRIANSIKHLGWRAYDRILRRLALDLVRSPVIFGPRDRVLVESNVRLQNAILNTMSGSIIIGNGTFFGHGVMVLTGAHRAPDQAMGVTRMDNVVEGGRDIAIGDDVWVGSGAILIGPLRVGDGATIAAGSVVVKDIASGVTVGGIPAVRLS